MYLVLAAGVGAGFSTGDLFHLFVSFEILLMASYVLLTLDGDEAQVRAGTTYVVINTIESVVLVVAVGLVYAATGTLSMAELPTRLAELDPAACAPGCSCCCSSPSVSRPRCSRCSSGCPTRTRRRAARSPRCSPGCSPRSACTRSCAPQTLLFPGAHRTLLLWVAGLTMIVGVLGAIAQNDIKRILSFHIVSQIGYMVLGIAIGGPAAIAATIFFLIHQIPVKTSLFLVDGMVEHAPAPAGSTGSAGWPTGRASSPRCSSCRR